MRNKDANTAPLAPPGAKPCNAAKMLAISLVGGLSALLTQPRALGTASHGASRSGHVRCLIKGEVDAAAMFAASTFPIKPDALIERAKEVLEAGVGTKDGGACLAPDFEFCAAVVGPLGKEQYLGALDNFRVRRHARDQTMTGSCGPAGPASARNAPLPCTQHALPTCHALQLPARRYPTRTRPLRAPATRTRTRTRTRPHPNPPQLEDAFPDINPNYYGFFVDPFEPHRVWFMSRCAMPRHAPPAAMHPPAAMQPAAAMCVPAQPVPCIPGARPPTPARCWASRRQARRHVHASAPAGGQQQLRGSSSAARAAGWPRPAEARGGREPAGRGWPRAWANGWLPT